MSSKGQRGLRCHNAGDKRGSLHKRRASAFWRQNLRVLSAIQFKLWISSNLADFHALTLKQLSSTRVSHKNRVSESQPLAQHS